MKYITEKGDTWDIIAYKAYGNEELIAPLIEANRAYVEKVVFDYGIEITIPELEQTDDSIFMPPWRKQ